MISKNTIQFLKALKQNNHKEWFDAHKKQYEEAKKEFEIFISSLIPEIARFDHELKGITAKECVFRIYRDVRFSKDKTPYKSHFGAYIANGGRKSPFGGYYVHIEPGASFLAGGIFVPQPDILKAVREEIVDNIDDLKKIIFTKKFTLKFGDLWGEKLKTIPKGFPKDFEYPELLKMKSFCPMLDVPDAEIIKTDYPSFIVKTFKEMHPFNAFLNKVIHYVLEEKN